MYPKDYLLIYLPFILGLLSKKCRCFWEFKPSQEALTRMYPIANKVFLVLVFFAPLWSLFSLMGTSALVAGFHYSMTLSSSAHRFLWLQQWLSHLLILAFRCLSGRKGSVFEVTIWTMFHGPGIKATMTVRTFTKYYLCAWINFTWSSKYLRRWGYHLSFSVEVETEALIHCLRTHTDRQSGGHRVTLSPLRWFASPKMSIIVFLIQYNHLWRRYKYIGEEWGLSQHKNTSTSSLERKQNETDS
jgi:hypothetical protein